MATTKNKNLFYQLYSTDNSVTDSGYKCTSSTDESDTSFDISGTEAQITDSNGDILASVDLSSIHAAGITQYNVETKILQPKSAYLLQGNEYGETYKSQFFKIYDFIYKTENYSDYINLKFDILYKQKNKKCNIHIDTYAIRETYGSVTSLVQQQLNKLKVPITCTIRTLDDEESSDSTIDYINFQSSEEGYDFIVRNVILTPILNSDSTKSGSNDEFSDSPFNEPEVTTDLILELLNKYKPTYVNADDNSSLNSNNYNINCDIYKKFLTLGNTITDDFNLFVYELGIIKKYFLPCFDEDGTLIFKKKLEDIIAVKYSEIYKKYFTCPLCYYNPYTIYNILTDLKDYIFTQKNASGPSYCYEDLNKRINNIKYPNGALRGIVLIPNWPTDDDYEYSVLWVNHVADHLEICEPVSVSSLNQYFNGNVTSNRKARLFEKIFATVKINALISDEKQQYIEDYDNLPLNDITSNDGFTNSFDNLYEAGYDDFNYVNKNFNRNPVDYNRDNWNSGYSEIHNPDLYIENNTDDEDIWENNPNKTDIRYLDSHENIPEKYVGLYKYMNYLSNNDLWLRIGDAYMIIGKDDNKETKTKNLLQSLLVYNPNDIPVKVKYIIFS